MTTAKEARKRLNDKAAGLNDEMLLESIYAISKRGEAIEVVVVRVSLLNEYEKRFGGDAVDLLMDQLGL